MPFILQTIRCYTAVISGLVNLVTPVSQVFGAIIGKFLQTKFASVSIKLLSSIVVIAVTITLGYTISYNIAIVIVVAFFFATSLTIFFVANDAFVMHVGTPDVRGMLGGCL